MNRSVICIFCVSLSACFTNAHAETALIATASNFRNVAEKLETAFERQSSHDISLVSGATGMLLAQVSNGAPFDVFLGADQTSAARLEVADDAVAGTRFTYAIGRLVLISTDRRAFAQGAQKVLEGARFRRLAIANPALAPYGVAAQDVIQHYGLQAKLTPKYALAQNVGQAFAFVASGNAEFGFVAFSYVADADNGFSGAWWEPPEETHRAIRQDAVLLTRAKDNAAAKAFLQFLKSPEGVSIIEASGYRAPK
jgi:molybdate transport system substrate-binding protein